LLSSTTGDQGLKPPLVSRIRALWTVWKNRLRAELALEEDAKNTKTEGTPLFFSLICDQDFCVANGRGRNEKFWWTLIGNFRQATKKPLESGWQ